MSALLFPVSYFLCPARFLDSGCGVRWNLLRSPVVEETGFLGLVRCSVNQGDTGAAPIFCALLGPVWKADKKTCVEKRFVLYFGRSEKNSVSCCDTVRF